MASNQAFRNATLLTMATPQGEKKSVLNTNAGNIQRILPGLDGAPEDAIYQAYINSMTELETTLLPPSKKKGAAVVDPNGVIFLANIVKILSSPQVSGLYALLDFQAEMEPLIPALQAEAAIDELNLSEPAIFIMPANPALKTTLTGVDFEVTGANIGQNFLWKDKIVKAFFDEKHNRDAVVMAMFPKVEINEKDSYTGEIITTPDYLSKVALSLFEVRGNTVTAARYSSDKPRSVLDDVKTSTTLANITSKGANKGRLIFNGITMIPRSAVTRLYLRSLKAALQSKWESQGAGGAAAGAGE